MFRLLSHLRPRASAAASRLRPSSAVPHLRPSSTVPHLRPGTSVAASRLGPSSTVYAITPVNTHTNTFQYGVRHMSSLKPAEPGSSHGGKSDGGKNKSQDDVDALALSIAAYLATFGVTVGLGLVCLNFGHAFWFNWYRKRCMDAALEGTHPDSDSDGEGFADRPDVEKLFEHVVKSCPSAYSVIIGNQGTGKSTLAANVARKTPGVLYVNVPHEGNKESLIDILDFALRAALDWRQPVTPWVSQPNSKRILILCSLCRILINFCPDDFSEGFYRTMHDFELAAARYKARHGSCAVLIIDNLNTDNCNLRLLQGIAKEAADNRLYKVVFVTNGIASAAMKRESG